MQAQNITILNFLGEHDDLVKATLENVNLSPCLCGVIPLAVETSQDLPGPLYYLTCINQDHSLMICGVYSDDPAMAVQLWNVGILSSVAYLHQGNLGADGT